MLDGKFELTYSFDKDYAFTSMRVTVTPETEVQSITGVYGGAFLYENEIKELFGVKFAGINIDYNGHFYKKKIDAPFGKNAGVAGK
jgi:ech hydrogenase subunit D